MGKALILCCALALCTAAPALAVGELPDGGTTVFIGQSGASHADAVEAATGIAPAGSMWYVGLYEEPAAVESLLDEIDAAVAARPGLLVDIGVSFGAISTPSPSYGAAIAAGAFDDRIDLLAGHLKALPSVAYLRLGYEFDLLGGQYGPAEVYKAAYTHIVDRLRSQGVSNAVYVWHSAGAFWRGTDPSLFAVSSGTLAKTLSDAPVDIDPQPITAFYPGDGYVDAFGISYWQDSCCFGRSAQQARDVYEARTREILAQAQAMGLPLRIAESTPVNIGADSGDESVGWLDNTFKLIDDFDIAGWNLISIDWPAESDFFGQPFWNGYWPDARIHHFNQTRERYMAGVSDERFVHRSPDLPQQLGLL